MSDLFVCVVYGVVRPSSRECCVGETKQGDTSKFEFAREPMLVRLADPRGRYALEATPGDSSAGSLHRVGAHVRIIEHINQGYRSSTWCRCDVSAYRREARGPTEINHHCV